MFSKTVKITNRTKSFTSRKAAEKLVRKKRARWVTPDSIECIATIIPSGSAIQADGKPPWCGWVAIASQRGGKSISFEWHSSMSNGFVVMGGRPVVMSK